MSNICDIRDCTGCGACAQVCPKQCIQLKPSEEGFLYPSIDKQKCINCDRCKKICPNNCQQQRNDISDYYMAINRDITVLKRSSSGGVFTALADYVFQRNGVVFGAVMSKESHEVSHVVAEDRSELDAMRLSKYYQSTIGETFSLAKRYLQEGRMVLFSGTACQIAGLYQVCGHPDKLITVDVLCHGVTSKKFVDAYVKSQERKFKKTINNYWFRVKDDKVGWNRGGYSNET